MLETAYGGVRLCVSPECRTDNTTSLPTVVDKAHWLSETSQMGKNIKFLRVLEKQSLMEALVGDVGSSVGDCVGMGAHSFV